MSLEDLDQALKYTLRWEGGFVDDPDDAGGATNFGITQNTYNEYREDMDLQPRSVKLIEGAEVGSIYLNGYWKKAGCDKLKAPLSFVLFDCAVNHGVTQAVLWLQRNADMAPEKVDGVVGKVTLDVVQRKDPVKQANDLLDDREDLYHLLVNRKPSQAKFLTGWLNRSNFFRDIVRSYDTRPSAQEPVQRKMRAPPKMESR